MSRGVDLMTLKHSSYGSVPLAMLNGNLRFPRVLDVAPKPANDLVLESTQGKLKPKAFEALIRQPSPGCTMAGGVTAFI